MKWKSCVRRSIQKTESDWRKRLCVRWNGSTHVTWTQAGVCLRHFDVVVVCLSVCRRDGRSACCCVSCCSWRCCYRDVIINSCAINVHSFNLLHARLIAAVPDDPPSPRPSPFTIALVVPSRRHLSSPTPPTPHPGHAVATRWDSRRRWVPGKSLLNGITWCEHWSAVNRRTSGLDGVD